MKADNILQDCFHVPRACAACLDAMNDPSPGLDVSKHLGQADRRLPERGQETGTALSGCMDSGGPFVASKGHLLTQT